MITAPLS